MANGVNAAGFLQRVLGQFGPDQQQFQDASSTAQKGKGKSGFGQLKKNFSGIFSGKFLDDLAGGIAGADSGEFLQNIGSILQGVGNAIDPPEEFVGGGGRSGSTPPVGSVAPQLGGMQALARAISSGRR